VRHSGALEIAVLAHLQRLSSVSLRPSASEEDVLEACELIRDALGAEEAYVVRGGDPHFVVMGSDEDPVEYEVKQKGYWMVWRQLATNPDVGGALFDVADRRVIGGKPLVPGTPATHLGSALPALESHSDMLVVHGEWRQGLTAEEVQFVESARAMLAPLVGSVIDSERHQRQKEQLTLLASVSDAFNHGAEPEELLTRIATAMASASGLEWVHLVTYNEDLSGMRYRVFNEARHSGFSISSEIRGTPSRPRAEDVRIGVELAPNDSCILISDVFAPGLEERADIEPLRDQLPRLLQIWQRAHISAMATFPIVFQSRPLGHVSFLSSTVRQWREEEVTFLKALVAQAATSIHGLNLFRALEASREEGRQREERFRALVQNASDLITVVANDGTVAYQSPSIQRVLGMHSEEAVGLEFASLIHPDDLHRIMPAVAGWAAPASHHAAAEIRMRHADGTWRHVECVGADLRDDINVNGVVLNIRDITERKRLEHQLLEQALHDPLTGLLNRRALTSALDTALLGAANSEVGMLFIDLDNFKEVNDTLGHETGDRVLLAVAARIRACVRPADTIARLGGDEFAILIDRLASIAGAVQVAERVLAALERPLHVDGREITIGASIGVAASGTAADGRDREALLRAADVAMYAAKAEGKSCFRIFEPAMLTNIVERRALIDDLRAGFDEPEFVLQYQPLLSLASGGVVGIEALVRWHHPQRGLVAPDDFIPLAEESGVVLRLGNWVLQEACKQGARWQSLYPGLGDWSMSVNVSVKQLQHPDFVHDVQKAIQDSGIQPRRLVLEMTESVMIHDPRLMLRRMRDLKTLGVGLAVDDFATGYSSLTYLREFPFDLLKIDKGFVADIGLVEPGHELARVIIELGKTLGVPVVAEGIERHDQLTRLQSLDCDFGQGYYFSEPLDSAGVELFLGRADKGGMLPHAA
jgi:diguanylate cyclase (GGDEF)-like protein/PAS domain S-box-containing protein